jgi:hypothetical protein
MHKMFIQLFSLLFICYNALTKANIISSTVSLYLELTFALLISLPLVTQMCLVLYQASQSEMGYLKLFFHKALIAFCGEYSDFVLHSISEKNEIGFKNHMIWVWGEMKTKRFGERGIIYQVLTTPLVAILFLFNWVTYCDPFSRKLRYESRLGLITSKQFDWDLLSATMGRPAEELKKEYTERDALGEADKLEEEDYYRFCIGTVTIYYEKLAEKRKFKITKLNGIETTHYNCSGNKSYRKKVIYCFKMLEKGFCFADEVHMTQKRSIVHCSSMNEILKLCKKDIFCYLIDNAHIGGKIVELDDPSFDRLMKHNELFWGIFDASKLELALRKTFYRKKPEGVGNKMWKQYLSDVSRYVRARGLGFFTNFTLMEKSRSYDILEGKIKHTVQTHTPSEGVVKLVDSLDMLDGLNPLMPKPKKTYREKVEEVRVSFEVVNEGDDSNSEEYDACFEGFTNIIVKDGKISKSRGREFLGEMVGLQKKIAERICCYHGIIFDGFEEARKDPVSPYLDALLKKNAGLYNFTEKSIPRKGRISVPYWNPHIASSVKKTVKENKALVDKILGKEVSDKSSVKINNKFVKVERSFTNPKYDEEVRLKLKNDSYLNLELKNKYSVLCQEEVTVPSTAESNVGYFLKMKKKKISRELNPVIMAFELEKYNRKKLEYLGVSNIIVDLSDIATGIKRRLLETEGQKSRIHQSEILKIKRHLNLPMRLTKIAIKEALQLVGVIATFPGENKFKYQSLKETVPVFHKIYSEKRGKKNKPGSGTTGNHSDFYRVKYRL